MTSGSSDRLTDFSSSLFRFLSTIIFWTTLLLVIIINKLVFRLKVTGRSNLSAISKTGCFLISNHTLYLDPAIIAHAISPRRTLFSALQSTFKIPVIGKYIRFLGAFPIPENNGLGKIIKPIKEALDKGWLIHFFPEGELHHFSQDIDEFQNGVFFSGILIKQARHSYYINTLSSYIVWIQDKPLFHSCKGCDRRTGLCYKKSRFMA
ncbi:hypothetical protein ES705_09338 [subsurface metagenome]